MESLVPITTLLFVKIWVTNELQGVGWVSLIVKFAFLDVVSGAMNVFYGIGMAD